MDPTVLRQNFIYKKRWWAEFGPWAITLSPDFMITSGLNHGLKNTVPGDHSPHPSPNRSQTVFSAYLVSVLHKPQGTYKLRLRK